MFISQVCFSKRHMEYSFWSNNQKITLQKGSTFIKIIFLTLYIMRQFISYYLVLKIRKLFKALYQLAVIRVHGCSSLTVHDFFNKFYKQGKCLCLFMLIKSI